MRKIDLFESKDELIQQLTKQIKDNEYKYLEEKQLLNNKILKLEREVEIEKEKYEEVHQRYTNIKKDMNLIEKINEKQNMELEKETVKVEIVEDLREKILDLSTKIEKVTSELLKEKDKNLDMKLELREKELEIKREEVRADELTKEIEFLELKIQEWEEKYDNDKIQGNAHIGLSRIDFMAVNALDKNNSERNSFQKSYLYASVYNGGGGGNASNKKSPIRGNLIRLRTLLLLLMKWIIIKLLKPRCIWKALKCKIAPILMLMFLRLPGLKLLIRKLLGILVLGIHQILKIIEIKK